MVAEGSFREDLFYRVGVVQIAMPPLRERREDIPLLVANFVAKFTADNDMKQQKSFSTQALNYLTGYDWPGNIRELRNVVERAFIICSGDVIYPENLSILQNRDNYVFDDREDGIRNLQDYLRRLEYEYIEAAYRKYGNVRDAAKSLGMSAPTFTRKKNRGPGE